MAQTINTNVMSLNAQRNLNTTQGAMAQATQRLSTGLRVNSARDDSAGLAIAERMNTQVRGMNVAIRNANDGISLAQTAEGAIGKVGDMAQRMRELAVQSSNATNTVDDRLNLDAEYQALASEITRTLESTTFNGKSILASTDTDNMIFQVGANADATNQIEIENTNLTTDATVTAVTGGAVTDFDTSQQAITDIDEMIKTISTKRAEFGATQNRFDVVVANLQVSAENQAAARGRIMDADFAAETAELTRSQVLQQAGTAMLSQANAAPQNVLSLLR